MTTTQSTTARAGSVPNKPLPEAEAYTFRAPRFGDLVACPYCDAETFSCDHCGGERHVYVDEVMQ